MVNFQYLSLSKSHIGGSCGALSKRKPNVIWGQTARRHLVQERLKGVVVVSVNHRDPVRTVTQLGRQAHPSKTDSNNNNM
jgi:hypothetical protein